MKDAPESLCARFGLGPEERGERLKMVGIVAADHQAARDLNVVIADHLDGLADGFYRHLTDHEAYREFLPTPELVRRLTETMRHYLLTLGVEFDSEAYFESRLRIGVVHRRIDLPLSLYQTAYALLQQLILETLPAEDLRRLGTFVLRITALDMMLAIETYHRASVETLTGRIDAMRAVANEDALTGAASRRHFVELLQSALDGRRAAERVLAVLIIDLDHFKRVNDNHGHLVGDEVLRAVVRRLSGSLREGDEIGRLGGEEFGVLLGAADAASYREVGERLVREIAREPIAITARDLDVPVTISVGAALARTDESRDSLLERADRALYAAKTGGRNRVCVAEDAE